MRRGAGGDRREGRAGGILSYFARHATAANLVLVLMIALGLAALPKMRSQFFPDVVVEEMEVSVVWQGAGAEDIDRAIVQVLDPVLLAVEGVTGSTARATEGRASLSLEFEPGWDMARAAADVQAAVDLVGDLPSDAEEPQVRRSAWRDRVTDVVITGPVGVDQLGRFADEFVARLFAAGVTRTTIRGLAETETLVEVPTAALVQHGLTMAGIAEAIGAEVTADPAGDVGSGAARVRTGNAKQDARAIAAIVLKTGADGAALRVGDVARIEVLGIDRSRAAFVGDNPALTVRVDRSDRGDAIAIQAAVQTVADQMQPTLPAGTEIRLVRTRAEAITGRLNILLDNGAMGLALVLALLFLFLNARTALWVAAGIPVSMLAAIAAMHAFGLTFNMVSLFALIITLGIVVDDAIVVGEHADARARRGETPVEAAENAARRMAAPVFSATVTTVIAFFGLVAIGGHFGTMIADIPFTVIAVLAASLVECFVILPNHMVHALAHAGRAHWYDWPSRQVNRGFSWVRDRAVRPLVAGVIVARYPVMALALVALALQAALLVTGKVPWRFFNAPEQGSVTGNFAMLPGATRADTLAMMRELQRATEALGKDYEARYGRNPLDFVMAETGGNSGRALAGSDTKDEDLLGAISIELIDPDLRPYSSFQFVGELQEAVRAHPLLEEVSFRGWRSGPGGDALSVDLFGAEAEVLKAAAEAIKTALLPFPEVSALEDSLAYDKDELVLDLTAQGQALGFTIDELGRVLRHRLNGIEAASYPDGPRSATIRVELPSSERTADFLDRTLLQSRAGQAVPLADIVTVQTRAGFSTVRRENGVRVVTVSGDIAEDDPARAAEITRFLTEEVLPDVESRFGVASRQSGLAEDEREFLNDALLGFLLCLVGIYLVLAWVFSSWTRPMVVMAVIPFGLVGAIWGHNWWEVPLSMFSVVGLIGMSGIIINDSIVLITTIDDYARTRGLKQAIVDGVADRLRPVFLTTATTVLGLAPLLFESSSQAQFLKPTVITLVYGLGFGMVLVLLVVPALLAAQLDIARQFRSLRHARRLPRRARAAALLPGLAALAMAGAFAATLGAVIVTGHLPAALDSWVPGGAKTAALVLFVIAAAAIAVLALMAGMLARLVRPAG